MSVHSTVSPIKQVIVLIASLVGIFLFLALIFVLYLGDSPKSVDYAIKQERKIRADQARAAGREKITGYKMIDAQQEVVQIPIEQAKQLVLERYKN